MILYIHGNGLAGGRHLGVIVRTTITTVPDQSSYYWLTTRLRGEFGFRGYVVSDKRRREYFSPSTDCRRHERNPCWQSVLAD